MGSEHARRSATVCGLPVAPAYVLDDPKHLDTNGMAYVMGEGIPRVQEGFAMKKSIVAVIVSLAVAPVAARAFTLTSGQPVGSDISLVACGITNASPTATLVIDRIDFVDSDGHSCSALETSGCGSSSGGPLPAGGSIQQMCNTPTQAPPSGCGSTVRCVVEAHGVSATKVRALATYFTGTGPILTLY